MSMEFYGDLISKCHMIMKERTPVPCYKLISSPSTKLKLKDNHYQTPCSISCSRFLLQNMSGRIFMFMVFISKTTYVVVKWCYLLVCVRDIHSGSQRTRADVSIFFTPPLLHTAAVCFFCEGNLAL